MTSNALLTVLIFAAALVYSSVGHAGASGYLAAMSLMGVQYDVMRPTALVLNILVAAIATFRFQQAGCFSWKLFWPFAAGSIPLAYIGGRIQLPGHAFKIVVGIVLLVAAARLIFQISVANVRKDRPPVALAIFLGAIIGLVSGLTGTGGGIFLSPLLLLVGWSEARTASGVAAAFVLVNSVAGLAGAPASVNRISDWIIPWAIAAVAGGLLGAHLGSKRLAPLWIRRVLGVVLIVAGVKLILVP